MTLEEVVREMPPRLGRKRLSFEEVVSSGRTAVFQEFGDLLLYLEGTVFVLKDADPRGAAHTTPPVLERRALAHAVGIESGWRHAAGCNCPVCAAEVRLRAA